jgi:hypothetical protein
LAYPSPAPIENARRDLADRRAQNINFFGRRVAAPTARLEPSALASQPNSSATQRRSSAGSLFFSEETADRMRRTAIRI